MRYRDAGVDIGRADAIKAALARAVESTWNPQVHRLRGGFAGVMRWPGPPGAGPAAAAGASPALVAATLDGVGSKLELARGAGRLRQAAADLVYHGANDLLVHGARPLAFLDYVAQARLDPDVVLAVVEGVSEACREVGAALLGGETAEMPDTYRADVVDVAGCMIGWVAEGTLLDGSAVRPGDVVLGLGSDGLHTNGYTLARRVLERSGVGLEAPLPGGGGERLGEALLAPHRWYGRCLAPALEAGAVHALAHVTGGGLAGNLVRVLPEGCRARLDPDAWPRPALFQWLIAAGEIPEDDARTAFNLGIGMAVVCAPGGARELAASLLAHGERVAEIGVIAAGARGVEWAER
jgi:phosphoribosylformylglycinamidine cyclo-ligase